MGVGLGDLRERVEIRREARTRRADGGYDRAAPTLVATVWARVRPVVARESEQAGRLAGTTTYLVDMRRRTDLTTDDRLVWLTGGSLALNIREVRVPGPRDVLMVVVAEAKAVL